MINVRVEDPGPENQSVEESISDLLSSLDFDLIQYYEEEYKEFIQYFRAEVEDGKTFESLAHDWHFIAFFDKENIKEMPNKLLGLAICNYLKAKNEFSNNRNGDAIKSICKANMYLGMTDIYRSDHYKPILLGRAYKHESNRKAGVARHEKYRPVIDKAIELLKAKCPVDGWEDEPHAAQELKDELASLIRSKKYSLQHDLIDKTLISWIKKRKDVAAAFRRRTNPNSQEGTRSR